MTLQEIYEIRNDPRVVQRVHGAMVLTAYAILSESPSSTARQDWAKSAIRSPDSLAGTIVAYVLAANQEATVEQVLSASDDAYTLNVGNAVSALIGVPDAA